ncbi:hypothetical protein T4D_5847 [Trichinella pseudospiralis]|uniref:Uncharacterized protein n=1 Tax=Trichinella pseudospiralis TaxID=6337 RepID=A0A0V1FC60_TRIPS|nr:hypothetical protein T4D_5847 [Trichinella pseudospiralis]
MLLLATERRNYVTPIRSVSWCFRHSSQFGSIGKERLAKAELIRLSEQSALMMVPTCLEIFGAGQFWDEFRANVLSSDQGQFFSRLGCLMLRQCRMEVDQLCDVLCKSPSLTMVELVDLMFLDEGVVERLVPLFDNLSIIGLSVSSIETKLLDMLFPAVMLNLEILNFVGNEPFRMSDLTTMRAGLILPCVQLLSLCSFQCDVTPVNEFFFTTLLRYFPNLTTLFFDWSVLTPAVCFDQQAQEALQGIGWLHEQPKMVVTSLLIYSPDEDTKTAVKLIDQYLTDHLKLRHSLVEFSYQDGNPTNFSLIIIGKLSDGRAERLTEVIAGNRITQPDLRHWRYVLQNVQGFWKPDLTMQFGGLNENEVQACAGTAQKRQHAAAIAETCLQEVVNNNVTT